MTGFATILSQCCEIYNGWVGFAISKHLQQELKKKIAKDG